MEVFAQGKATGGHRVTYAPSIGGIALKLSRRLACPTVEESPMRIACGSRTLDPPKRHLIPSRRRAMCTVDQPLSGDRIRIGD